MPPKYTTHTQNPVLKTINADTKLFEFPHSTERNLHTQMFANDAGTATKLACDSSGNLNVSVEADNIGLATEAKQDTMIGLLEGQTPALNRTHAIPVQIMVGDAGGNYDALRANGQDLLVKIDDMDSDCAVNSGLATSSKQDTTHFLMGLLATKAEQLDQGTSLTNIDNSTANIDGKIAKSVVVGSDGTTSAQVVMACGSNDGTNLRTIATNDTGDVRSLLIGTDNGGTTHEIQTSNSGVLITEIEHSWDTQTLLTSTALSAGSAITTNAIDIGQGISHEYSDINFFVDNSNTSVSISLQPQSSPDNINWYVSASNTSVSTTQAKSFMCADTCFNFGQSRYMRLRIVNNDASLSTNVAVQTGRYK